MKLHFWLELAWVFGDEFFLGKIQISDFVEDYDLKSCDLRFLFAFEIETFQSVQTLAGNLNMSYVSATMVAKVPA